MNGFTPSTLLDDEEALDWLAASDSENGYMSFLRYVVINAQPYKAVFREIGESWQWDRERRSAGAIDYLAGMSREYDGPLSFWHGYSKGSDKTHAVARKLCFLLGWSRKRLHLYACAGDRDQASLVTMAMRDIIKDNPWIGERVSVATFGAQGLKNDSVLTVLSMDAWTGQGIFPDYIVAEEVTHWMYDEGHDFWNFVLSSVNKRPGCVFEVCTNAGHIGSWQWDVRKVAMGSKFWSFFEAPSGMKQLASWMNEEKIAEDSKLMDPGEVRRLYGNEWIDPGEERGYLTLAEAQACVDETWREQIKGERSREYYIAIDYGGVADRTALAILHPVKGTDRIVVDRLDCWQGSHKHPVAIDRPAESVERSTERSVEEWLEISLKNFPTTSTLVFDPYQMESLAQKFERKGYRVVRFEYRGGKSNYQMAQLLQNYVRNGKISWSPDAGCLAGVEDDTFAKELARLVKKPMSYGYRFDHEVGRHDDRASAVGSALVVMVPEMPPVSGGPKSVPVAETPTIRGIPLGHKDWATQRGLFGLGRR